MKPKFFLITTVPESLIFFKGQITFLKSDFDISLVSSPGEELARAAENDHVNSFSIVMERDIKLFKDLVSLIKLTKLFYIQRPQIIHCNTPKGSLLSLIAGYIARVPHRVYFVHGLRYQGALGLKRKLLILMEKISCIFATDIIAVSEGVRKVLKKEITGKEVQLIASGSANGINVDLFDRNNYDKTIIKRELQIPINDFVFGFVGRLVGDKGINELVNVFKTLQTSFPDIILVLVGGFEHSLDPLMPETIKEIEENKKIVAVGSQADVRPFLSIFDVLSFPSYREGFGMSVMEANAMGVPAIVSDITGCNEIIQNGVNGFLIEPKNEKDLLEKMQFCVLNDAVLSEMSLNCREIIQAKFAQDIVWNQALETYKSIVYSRS